MKNKLLLTVLFMQVLFAGNTSAQQINPPGGWYTDDSVWVTITTINPNDSITVSINTISEDGFHQYQGGFWVYPRREDKNTWENQILSRGPIPWYWPWIDTLAPRGPLKKANQIRVRKYQSDTLVSETVSYIHVGESNPHSLPVVYLTVDSLDAFGPEGFYGPGDGIFNFFEQKKIWNYQIDGNPIYLVPRERYEKRANIQVMENGIQVLDQVCGIRISGQSSVHQTNKTMAVVARKSYSESTFGTNLFGAYSENKWLKFRIRVDWSFAQNEIGLDLLKGMKMGELPYRPVVIYLNGSYWTLAFMQDKPNEISISKLFDIDNDSITVTELFQRVYLDSMAIEYFLGLGLDTSTVATIQKNDSLFAVAFVEKNKPRFERWYQELNDSLFDQKNVDTFKMFTKLIDIDNVSRYVSFVNFIGNTDAIGNNVTSFIDDDYKMKLSAKDFDGSFSYPEENKWNLYPYNDNNVHTDLRMQLVLDYLFKETNLAARMVLVYQDLLNTSFQKDRIVGIGNHFFDDQHIMDEYPRYSESWKPNIFYDSVSILNHIVQTKYFLENRTDLAWMQLAQRWNNIIGHGDSLKLSDRNTIRICMDSVVGTGVIIKLNSLSIDTTWQGVYYPNPAVDITAQKIPAGFHVAWKEFPDSTAGSLALHADSTIVVTPVLVQDTSVSNLDDLQDKLSIVPNPATSWIVITSMNQKIEGVTIVDVTGAQIMETSGIGHVDVQNLPNGTYFVRVSFENKNKLLKKLIVAH